MDSGVAARVGEVIERSGCRHGEFAALVGMDAPKLSKSLRGIRRFTSLELALIAERGGVTVDWLLTGRGSSLPAVAARAAEVDEDAAGAAVARAEHLEEIWSSLTELGALPVQPPLSAVVPRGRMVEQGAELARVAWTEVRRAGREQDVAGDLPSVLETVFGVDVEVASLGDGLDGLSYRRGGFRLALVSGQAAWTRQRFTAAHELGHLLAGDGGGSGLLVDRDVMAAATRRDHTEMRANAFAAAFLMPEDAVRGRVGEGDGWFAPLASDLVVSPSALAWRLFSLGLVDEEDRRRLSGSGLPVAALHGSRARFGSAGPTVSRPCLRLLAAAEAAYGRGDLSVRPLAALLGRSPEDVLAALEPGAPPPAPRADAEEPVFLP